MPFRVSAASVVRRPAGTGGKAPTRWSAARLTGWWSLCGLREPAGPDAATEQRLASIPRGGAIEGLAHMDLVRVSTRRGRRRGRHAASAGTVVPGVTVLGARDIERISSGQRSHLQGLGVAAHVVRSTAAHPCGAGRKSLCRADARRAIRRTGRFGRESYGGPQKKRLPPTFPPYARYLSTLHAFIRSPYARHVPPFNEPEPRHSFPAEALLIARTTDVIADRIRGQLVEVRTMIAMRRALRFC